jgi:cytochrome P450
VIYSPYVVNRLEGVWGPDALAFRPERWLEMDKAPTPYAYLTFNAGQQGSVNLTRELLGCLWVCGEV